jgi:hypothetical protein
MFVFLGRHGAGTGILAVGVSHFDEPSVQQLLTLLILNLLLQLTVTDAVE